MQNTYIQTKFGDYLFIINKLNNGIVLTISTLDNFPIINLKMTQYTVDHLRCMLENVALGTESQFTYLPITDPNCRYILYIYRDQINYENIVILLYKQHVLSNTDKMIIKTYTHIDSGEVDNLCDAFVKINLTNGSDIFPNNINVNNLIYGFMNENRDINEEINDVRGTISNELFLQSESVDKEQAIIHEQIVADNTVYLKWLENEKVYTQT